MDIDFKIKMIPELDPGFVPAVLWNREYREKVRESGNTQKITIALRRPNGMTSKVETEIFPHTEEYSALNIKYIERTVKSMLWMYGGESVYIAGSPAIAAELRLIYAPGGAREFDYNLIGKKVYCSDLKIIDCESEQIPITDDKGVPLGRNFDGCRIGFDLGGSDRKCAAVIDGKVVYSEEVEWNPYFEKDPAWHKEGIIDTLKRAAAHLPRVDAIGGSAAGVYVNNQVRVASLFRGVSAEEFDSKVKNMFKDIQKEWGVPLVLINDGEVTALAGSISLDDNALLGISMGTSEAAGYVNPEGNITDWLNELAFAPVDYRENGPVDEWSGDEGCGVQFFCQQGVARLAPLAGIEFSGDMPFAERLVEVQKLISKGDDRARKIYSTIGTCFGYAIAHYSEFYDFKNLLILGRVTSGEGGELILKKAREVLECEFPELDKKINFSIPDEENKRHGQAVAAASLPEIKK